MGDGMPQVILILLLTCLCKTCVDLNCISCDNYIDDGQFVQICYQCGTGYEIDSSTQIDCKVDGAMVLGIAIAGSGALILQVVLLVLCKVYYQKINKRKMEFSLEDIRKDESDNPTNGQNLQSIKSEQKPFVSFDCATCKKDQSNVKTKCGHFFHVHCLRQRLEITPEECPSCKSKQFNPLKLACIYCHSHNSFMHIHNNRSSESLKEFKCANCVMNKRLEEQVTKGWQFWPKST